MAKARGDGRQMVSATMMAQHLGFERPNLIRLLGQGVIEKSAEGKYDLDETRIRYIRHLREARKLSPKSEAEADFQRSKSELIQLRIAQQKRQLINADEAFAQMDEMVGMFLTGLSGFAARCGGRELATRRAIERAVYDLRLEISQAATKLANERGEPELDEAPQPAPPPLGP
jgi:hypothetical protein